MENRKCHIVIIDQDYNFLRTYEEELIRKYSGSAEIQIITDPGYVDAYFSTAQDIDLLETENFCGNIRWEKHSSWFARFVPTCPVMMK